MTFVTWLAFAFASARRLIQKPAPAAGKRLVGMGAATAAWSRS